MKKKNNNIIKTNITNIYNVNHKNEKELELLFNEKLLNMIYTIEKNTFYHIKNEKE